MTGPQAEPDRPGATEVEEPDEFVEDVLDPDDDEDVEGSPQPPEGSAEPAADDAAPASETDPQAPARDERGRFAAKAAEPAPSGPGASPAPPAADAPPQTTDETPLSFTAGKEPWHIAGSKVHADGSVTIPAERVEEVKTVLGRGIHHQTSWRREKEALERRVREAEQAGTFERTRSEQIMERLETMIQEYAALAETDPSALDDLTDLAARHPQAALLRFLAGTSREWPKLKLEAERRAVAEERRQLQEGVASQQRDAEQAQLAGALDHHVEQVATKFPGVDAQQVAAYLKRQGLRSLFFRAEQDMPDAGLRAGDLGVLLEPIYGAFELVATAQRAAQAREATARKVEEQNRKAATAGVKVPGAVSASGGGAPAAKDADDEIPTFTTRAERDAWLAKQARRRT